MFEMQNIIQSMLSLMSYLRLICNWTLGDGGAMVFFTVITIGLRQMDLYVVFDSCHDLNNERELRNVIEV